MPVLYVCDFCDDAAIHRLSVRTETVPGATKCNEETVLVCGKHGSAFRDWRVRLNAKPEPKGDKT